MSNFENFDIKKAEELYDFYETKATLISNLINKQSRSKSNSIVGTKIELDFIPKSVAEQVLDELGYELTHYSHGFKCGGSCHIFAEISFIPKDSQTAEDN